MWLAYLLITIIYGLALGSFATALSWRLPRGLPIFTLKILPDKKDTSNKNRSECPKCHKNLGLKDLVPFFSWVFLKGKCRHCHGKISARYPLIESMTALLCVLFYLKFGFNLTLIPYIIMAPFLICLIAIDFEHKIIPDILHVILIGLGFCSLIVQGAVNGSPFEMLASNLPYSLIALFIYFIFALVLRLSCSAVLKKEALGLGDVKLFGTFGFWLGSLAFPYFLFFSGVSGIILAVFWQKATGQKEFPFGPALVVSFVICLLTSEIDFFTLV